MIVRGYYTIGRSGCHVQVLNEERRKGGRGGTAARSSHGTGSIRQSQTVLSSSAGFQVQATCQILDLDIGAIHLDITAVSGAGNLLGNLRSAVAGLLDPNAFLTDLIGTLNLLLGLLNQINQLIG